MKGIDLCVKILVFVKILFQGRRKEGQEFRSLEVRGKLIALKNCEKLRNQIMFCAIQVLT
jgi:hypothetical protein